MFCHQKRLRGWGVWRKCCNQVPAEKARHMHTGPVCHDGERVFMEGKGSESHRALLYKQSSSCGVLQFRSVQSTRASLSPRFAPRPPPDPVCFKFQCAFIRRESSLLCVSSTVHTPLQHCFADTRCGRFSSHQAIMQHRVASYNSSPL